MQSASHDQHTAADAELGLSVIVPLLNELAALPRLRASLNAQNPAQVILVDGGSRDGTTQWVRDHWQDPSVTLISSGTGRANQMNAGALHANSPMLLFLHADTQLPDDAKTQICHAPSTAKEMVDFWGRFDVQFSSSLWPMKVIAWFINTRSRLSSVATGDQAIFVHRSLFDKVGGFDEIPIMEDVAICKKMRSIKRPFCSRSKVITSARRWEVNGVVSTVLKMWWFRFAYFIGVSPSYLAKSYRNVRR